MKKTILTIGLAMLCLYTAQTQSTTYLAKVINQAGEPISGANIIIKGSSHSTKTDENGRLKLTNLGPEQTIILTCIGYQRKELSPQQRPENATIILTADQNQLKEIEINTGYYTVTEKQRTGSISGIKAQTIGQQPVSNPLQAMQGRMPGVYIQQSNGTPGSAISLQIRGRNSISAGNNPLYIVDGVAFDAKGLSTELSVSSAVYGTEGYSPLNGISPEDIQSIEVLKDADATAIYGSRGSNGVVLITTKKGRAGRTKIELSTSAGFSKVTRKLPMMNTEEFLQMRTRAFELDNAKPKATDYDLNGKWNQTMYTNWQDELIGSAAAFHNAKLSLSGGDQRNQFMLSGSYQKQGTVFPGTLGYQRISSHFSSSHRSQNDKLKLSLSAIYSNDDTDWVNTDLSLRAISLQPNAPELYKPDGSLNWENSTFVNPLRELQKKYLGNNGNLVANSVISYTPIANLELKVSLGYNDRRLNDKSYTPSTYYNPAENKTAASAIADFNTSSARSWIIEPQASYQKQTKAGRISLLTGMSFQRQGQEQLVLRGTGFSSDALISNIKAATKSEIRDYSNRIYKYAGFYGRINYAIADQYFVNLTGRRDGSSRFGSGKQFANFGAIGAAWLFSEQPWVKQALGFINFGKIRLSYGTSGNDQIGDYEYLSTYQSSGPYNGVTGLSPLRLLNPDFAWEVNRKLEAGIDLAFFNDRIRTSAGYYRNRSSSQLIDYSLAATTGFTSIRDNLNATVQNTGIELELSSDLIRKAAIKWQAAVNLTIPRNKLIAFPLLANSSYADQYVIGSPLNIRKVLQLQGVNPQSGIFEYKDLNGDGQISLSDDRETIMEIGQKCYGGLSNSISYKKLQLDFLFQFVSQTANSFRYAYATAPGRTANQPQSYIGAFWDKPGDQARLQRLTSGANFAAVAAYNNYAYSDASVEDASFIRLKNVSLYYNLRLFQHNISLYAQGQNLLTITNYFGLDPETASISLPPLRTISFGIRLNP